MTHPPSLWLAALRPGGQLAMPLITVQRGSFMLQATRGTGTASPARSLGRISFISFEGAHDPAVGDALGRALMLGSQPVQSLCMEAHRAEPSCWLHGDGFCLSELPSGGGAP